MSDTNSLREAWFAGWKAAKLHSAAQEQAFMAARLDGDRLVWAKVTEPPNPYPEEEQQPMSTMPYRVRYGYMHASTAYFPAFAGALDLYRTLLAGGHDAAVYNDDRADQDSTGLTDEEREAVENG
jgi:hypothetical protein